MLTGKTNTPQTHPNLFLLRETLIAAESGVPARPSRMDVNEQCAAQLIVQMRLPYQKPNLFSNLHDIPATHGARVNLSALAALRVG